MKTASSFDIDYAYTSLTLNAFNPTGFQILQRNITSSTGFQIDYNVALYDAKTVLSLSFLEFVSSNLGPVPMSRIGFGVAYHFWRMNGQRFLMDNGVEGKVWGISPALELSLGLSRLSIADPNNVKLAFSASSYDMIPRVLFEIPINPNFLIMLRAGYLKSLSFGQSGGGSSDTVNYSGPIFTVGFKLTTL